MDRRSRGLAVLRSPPVRQRGRGRRTQRKDAVSPVNLELVTLTEDRAVITWYTGYTGTDDGLGRMEPAPADGVVLLGDQPEAAEPGGRWPLATHAVSLRRAHRARAGRDLLLPSAVERQPGAADAVHAHQRQRGRYLRLRARLPAVRTASRCPSRRRADSSSPSRCATTCTWVRRRPGSSAAPTITGIQQVPGLPPYPEVMLESLVDDASALGASFLLAAGDITAEAAPVDLSRAGKLLKRFGKYRRDYFVTRGNHDRAHTGEAYASCRVGAMAGQRLLSRSVLPGRRADVLQPRAPRSAGPRARHLRQARTGQRSRRALHRAARLVPRRARQGARPADDRVRPPPADRREVAVPHLAEQHARGGQVATILDDYAQTARAVPASRRPHAPQQAHDQPGRPGRHDAGDRRGQGVPRRLLAAAAPHRRLRVELLQDPQPTRRGRGASAAARRSSASGPSSRSAAACPTATRWSNATLGPTRRSPLARSIAPPRIASVGAQSFPCRPVVVRRRAARGDPTPDARADRQTQRAGHRWRERRVCPARTRVPRPRLLRPSASRSSPRALPTRFGLSRNLSVRFLSFRVPAGRSAHTRGAPSGGPSWTSTSGRGGRSGPGSRRQASRSPRASCRLLWWQSSSRACG